LCWKRFEMHTLTDTGITTKNRLASAGAWLFLVEIDNTLLGGNILRYTSNMTAIPAWGIVPHAYYVMAMSFGEVQESLQGGLPRIDLRMSNLDANLNGAMNVFDGLRGATVVVYVVLSDNLAANQAELTEVFEVIETSADNQWVTFTLGYADPLGRRFPRDRYTATACRHAYKGAFCRLSSTHPLYGTECDHTLTHCLLRSNVAQFGGSPGVDEGIYQ
jgi:phage-related protein